MSIAEFITSEVQSTSLSELDQLQGELGITLELTGSRVICPNACKTDADWDYIGVVAELSSKAKELLEAGWTSGTSLAVNADGEVLPINGEFVSLKRGNVNLILTNKAAWKDRFMLATRAATRLGLTYRGHRIVLFQAVLYGNG